MPSNYAWEKPSCVTDLSSKSDDRNLSDHHHALTPFSRASRSGSVPLSSLFHQAFPYPTSNSASSSSGITSDPWIYSCSTEQPTTQTATAIPPLYGFPPSSHFSSDAPHNLSMLLPNQQQPSSSQRSLSSQSSVSPSSPSYQELSSRFTLESLGKECRNLLKNIPKKSKEATISLSDQAAFRTCHPHYSRKGKIWLFVLRTKSKSCLSRISIHVGSYRAVNSSRTTIFATSYLTKISIIVFSHWRLFRYLLSVNAKWLWYSFRWSW